MSDTKTTPQTGALASSPQPDVVAQQIAALQTELKKAQAQVATLQKETIENAVQAAPKTPSLKQGEMPVVSCRVKLSKDNDVALKEVTPAEVCLLVALHHKNVGDNPVHEFGTCTKTSAIQYTDPDNPKARPGHKPLFVDGKHVASEVKSETYTAIARNASDEVARLCAKYGSKRVRALFPGAIPTLPATFEEAIKLGVTMTLEDNKLSAGEIKL